METSTNKNDSSSTEYATITLAMTGPDGSIQTFSEQLSVEDWRTLSTENNFKALFEFSLLLTYRPRMLLQTLLKLDAVLRQADSPPPSLPASQQATLPLS